MRALTGRVQNEWRSMELYPSKSTFLRIYFFCLAVLGIKEIKHCWVLDFFRVTYLLKAS